MVLPGPPGPVGRARSLGKAQVGAMSHTRVVSGPPSTRATGLLAQRAQKRRELPAGAQGPQELLQVVLGGLWGPPEQWLSCSPRPLPAHPALLALRGFLACPWLPTRGATPPGTWRERVSPVQRGRRGQAFLQPGMVSEGTAVLGVRVNCPLPSLQREWGSLMLIFHLKVYVRRGWGYKAMEELG